MTTGDTDQAPRCPCRNAGDTRSYVKCCAPFHRGDRPAPTAEALMRSRYSAYVRRDTSYLLRTWHASTRPPFLQFEPGQEWLGLVVRAHRPSGDQANVRFEARSRAAGRILLLRETSRFVREGGQWFYVDGDFDPTA